MIVRKALRMAEHLSIQVFGLVENMTHLICPQCGARIELFGSEDGPNAAREAGLPVLASLPVDPMLSRLCDEGRIESYQPNPFQSRAVQERLLGAPSVEGAS